MNVFHFVMDSLPPPKKTIKIHYLNPSVGYVYINYACMHRVCTERLWKATWKNSQAQGWREGNEAGSLWTVVSVGLLELLFIYLTTCVHNSSKKCVGLFFFLDFLFFSFFK